MNAPLLAIDNLCAAVGDRAILNGLTLTVRSGEVHAIMGPNGSGKSTLTKVVAGHPAYAVTGGTIIYQGRDLVPLEAEARANAGVFISFQYPVEVPGVNNVDFLRMALNAKRRAANQAELKPAEFAPILKRAMVQVEMDESFKDRQLNTGFSGGQKKRNEILQMLVLEPTLAILDETDSGLDIDALRIVAAGINAFRRADRAIVLITHYQRLLELVQPDVVHVLAGGRLIKTGGKELATELERTGYDDLLKAAGL
jgi:Fe-S cluster assembly ATP-binding protein